MALVEMNMNSIALGMEVSVNVLLPEDKHSLALPAYQPDKKYPVIYVLHGFSDNYSSWIRKSILEYVAREYDCIVVMPEVNNSLYADRLGATYFTYIADELPVRIANYFPASTQREDTFIMGNSMGGYGAFLMALSRPDRYASAFSFSGILGIDYKDDYLLLELPSFAQNMDVSFGNAEAFGTSPYNLYRLAEQADPATAPRLFHVCGTADIAAYQIGLDFINHVREHTALEVGYEETSGAEHNWEFWNAHIQQAFDFFGLKKPERLGLGV